MDAHTGAGAHTAPGAYTGAGAQTGAGCAHSAGLEATTGAGAQTGIGAGALIIGEQAGAGTPKLKRTLIPACDAAVAPRRTAVRTNSFFIMKVRRRRTDDLR